MTQMQTANGIRLPVYDTHFREMIERGPLHGGKGTYQYAKFEAALAQVPLSRRRVALDIGAHVGLWTRVLADYFGMVHAFEMLPAHVDCLQMNTLGLVNVVIYENVVVGAEEGRATIVVEHENSGNTRVGDSTVPGTLQMPVKPLPAFFPPLDGSGPLPFPKIDFIKIDVEGYEMQVVQGAASIIKHCRPVMVVEQKGQNAERYGNRTGAVLDLLRSWGASIVWQRSGDFCLTWS